MLNHLKLITADLTVRLDPDVSMSLKAVSLMPSDPSHRGAVTRSLTRHKMTV